MVPMLALVISAAKGWGAQERLNQAFHSYLAAGQVPEQVGEFIYDIFALVEQTDFLALGTIGLIFLVWTVIKVMGKIEASFNAIWGVRESRTLLRKCADYLLLLLLVPIMVVGAFTLNSVLTSKPVQEAIFRGMGVGEESIPEELLVSNSNGHPATATIPLTGSSVASSVTATIDSQVIGTQAIEHQVVEVLPNAPDVVPTDVVLSKQEIKASRHVKLVIFIYNMTLRIFGILGIPAAFILLYIYLPNTKVQVKSAFIGGVFAGISWIIWQWVCIRFQVGISNFNKIYGAFATLPISLFWLHINWMIALFGAEISYAVQNHGTYMLDSNDKISTHASRRFLAFAIMYDICSCFRRGLTWKPDEFQDIQHVPLRLVQDITYQLKEQELVRQTEEFTFVPAKDPAHLSLWQVEKAIEGQLDERAKRVSDDYASPLVSEIHKRGELYRQALSDTTFGELLDEAGAPCESELSEEAASGTGQHHRAESLDEEDKRL